MKHLIASFLSLVLVAGLAQAKDSSYPEISRDDLKAAIADGKVALLDVNGSESYAKAHIPGAIDFAAVGDDLASKLPEDKSALIVAYCGSPACSAYIRGAEAAKKLGYTNIKHYAGGISEWKSSGEATE